MTTAPAYDWWRPRASAPGSPAATLAVSAREGGRLPFRALLAFLFVLLVAPQQQFTFLAPFRIALLTALLAIGAYVLERLSGDRPITVLTPEIRLVGLLVLCAVASVPLSYWPGGSVSFLRDYYLKTVAAFLLLANVVDTPRRLRTVAWAMSLMSVPLAVTAVRNYLSGALFAEGSNRIAGYEASMAGNPNDLALMLNLLLPLSGALLATAGAVTARVVLFGVMTLSVLGVVVTFSRAGFLTLAAVGFILVTRLFLRGRVEAASALVVLGLMGSVFLPGSYLQRIATITDIDADQTGSAQERWSDTKAAVSFVMRHPVLGAGVGMNVLALNEERGPRWKEVHNAYLEYAVELGIPGLLLFVLLLRRSLRSAREARERAPAGPRGSGLPVLAEGIELSLLAFAVAAFFHPVAYQYYFYLIAGLAVAARGACAAPGPVAVAPAGGRAGTSPAEWWRR